MIFFFIRLSIREKFLSNPILVIAYSLLLTFTFPTIAINNIYMYIYKMLKIVKMDRLNIYISVINTLLHSCSNVSKKNERMSSSRREEYNTQKREHSLKTST